MRLPRRRRVRVEFDIRTSTDRETGGAGVHHESRGARWPLAVRSLSSAPPSNPAHDAHGLGPIELRERVEALLDRGVPA